MLFRVKPERKEKYVILERIKKSSGFILSYFLVQPIAAPKRSVL